MAAGESLNVAYLRGNETPPLREVLPFDIDINNETDFSLLVFICIIFVNFLCSSVI